MRTIGKRNIEKLKAIVDQEQSKGLEGIALHNKVNSLVPTAWFELWESAQNEIERIIWDRSFANRFKK